MCEQTAGTILLKGIPVTVCCRLFICWYRYPLPGWTNVFFFWGYQLLPAKKSNIPAVHGFGGILIHKDNWSTDKLSSGVLNFSYFSLPNKKFVDETMSCQCQFLHFCSRNRLYRRGAETSFNNWVGNNTMLHFSGQKCSWPNPRKVPVSIGFGNLRLEKL